MIGISPHPASRPTAGRYASSTLQAAAFEILARKPWMRGMTSATTAAISRAVGGLAVDNGVLLADKVWD